MRFLVGAGLFSYLLMLGCSAPSGQWHWVRQEMTRGGDLGETIDLCEDYARTVETDGSFEGLRNARPYGGWGDFSFEFCMHQRGWELRFLPPGNSAKVR